MIWCFLIYDIQQIIGNENLTKLKIKMSCPKAGFELLRNSSLVSEEVVCKPALYKLRLIMNEKH
jgi:hypothetical protein